MDRRSWLWRRKSSEKSPGRETESSGSVSSHSERFSDDQTVSTRNAQSPEITSKVSLGDKEVNDNVKSLSEKLSEALLNIQSKEELVKQHAKVAEEAVSGWERAENEVLILKKQVEALSSKNTVLEERASHLDGALKECLRQLRQTKEEQEEKIRDTVSKKSVEWESTKSELETQLVNLRSQLHNAKASTFTLDDLSAKLESAEKDKSALKIELKRTARERDLSINAAENASKQHLESMKKLAKLEAELRKIKMVSRKSVSVNDHQSITASSVYGESFTDSQSDIGERLSITENEELGQKRSFVMGEIDLMDDFLEMERLAARPGKDSDRENGELQAMAIRLSELKEKLEEKEIEKMNLEAVLREYQNQLNLSREKLEEKEIEKVNLEAILRECQNQVKLFQEQLEEKEMEKVNIVAVLRDCQNQLKLSHEQLEEKEMEKMNLEVILRECRNQVKVFQEQHEEKEKEKTNLELILRECQNHVKLIQEQLKEKETELVDMKMKLSMENRADMEVEAMKMKLEKLEKLLEESLDKLNVANEEKCKVEMALEDANVKKGEVELQLRFMEIELEAMSLKLGNLEQEIKRERDVSEDAVAKSLKLENEIKSMKLDSQVQRSAIFEELKINQDKELAVAANKFAECQKTIASLGQQLQSLAAMEDLLFETDGAVEAF